jgi:hypothetical protein
MQKDSDELRKSLAETEHKVRLETLARIYEQADRVITGDPISVKLADTGPAPAWSDGKSITFNVSSINQFDIDELTQLNGLNYHELSHLEYTPRKSSKIVEYVLKNNLMMSFNTLEDQRIETLMVGRFPAVVPYLQATVARWLAAAPEDYTVNYVCVRGRRYLDPKVTEAFRDGFIDQSLLAPIARIVDEYRTLALPDDQDRAMVLIKEYEDEVLSKLPRPPSQGGPAGCGHRGPIQTGRPAKGKRQKLDSQRARKGERAADEVPEGSATNSTPTREEALEARSQSVGEKNDNPAPFSLEPGQSHVPSVGGIPDDVGKVLERSIEDALSRKDVQADIRSKQRVLLGGDGKHTDNIKNGDYSSTDVPAHILSIARRFQRELERLRSDAEPSWDTETPSGRLNIPRIIRGCEIDQSFDRWDEGNDSTDIEAVILVDRSGSMSSNENDRLASQACWVIKRALESIEAPVTVYGFDDKTEVVYKRTEKASRGQYKFIFGNGGTDPHQGLLEAERLFLSSRSKSKLLFLITDGQFSGGGTDEAMKRMSSRGVLTSMVMIINDEDFKRFETYRSSSLDSMWHFAEIRARIDSAATLIPFARSVVINAIKKRARS